MHVFGGFRFIFGVFRIALKRFRASGIRGSGCHRSFGREGLGFGGLRIRGLQVSIVGFDDGLRAEGLVGIRVVL